MLIPRFPTRIAANGGGQNDDTEKPVFMLRGCLSKCGLIILPDSFKWHAAARTRARERPTKRVVGSIPTGLTNLIRMLRTSTARLQGSSGITGVSRSHEAQAPPRHAGVAAK